jgi:3-hydroxybutyryl-CoA dehydrogenase
MGSGIEKVAVVGLGNLGAQIAVLAAANGYKASGYDPDQDIFMRNIEAFSAIDQSKVRKTSIKVQEWPAEAQKVEICSSVGEAVNGADIVIEAVPENLDIKLKVWAEIDAAASEHCILATNSSSMPVSKMEGTCSHPQNCLNIHLYRPELGMNMADVMGGSHTTPEVMQAGQEFVRSLGLVPLGVNKELLGFCFNRVWRAVKRETLHMWGNGFVNFKDVDRAWMIFTGQVVGPFALMDAVGLDVVWDIEMVYYNESQDPKDYPPQALKDMIESGHLGAKTGQGFYTYPDPEYARPEFLEP